MPIETIIGYLLHDLFEEYLEIVVTSNDRDQLQAISQKSRKSIVDHILGSSQIPIVKKYKEQLHEFVKGSKLRFDFFKQIVIDSVVGDLKNKYGQHLHGVIGTAGVIAHAVTRTPGEHYGTTVARITELQTYLDIAQRYYVLPTIGRLEFLMNIRRFVGEVKLLDAIYNEATEKFMVMSSEPFGDDAMKQGARFSKSLVKRCLVLDATRQILYDGMKGESEMEDYVPPQFQGMYGLNVLLGVLTIKRAQDSLTLLHNQYGHLPHDAQQRTLGQTFNHMLESLGPYEDAGLMGRATHFQDAVESAHRAAGWYGFSGTLNLAQAFAEGQVYTTNLLQINAQWLVAHFYQISLVLERNIARFLSLDRNGMYDPELRFTPSMGFVQR